MSTGIPGKPGVTGGSPGEEATIPAILGGPCGRPVALVKGLVQNENECPIVLKALRAGRELASRAAPLTVAGDT